MSLPKTLATIVSLVLAGCGSRAVPINQVAAEVAACPVDIVERGLQEDDICFGRSGANWSFAFAYPRAAAAIPALQAHLRAERVRSEADFEQLLAYARQHPELQLFHETVYTIDADLPDLLALSSEVGEYAGGAHGYGGPGALLWDRKRDRRLQTAELFSDQPAAMRQIEKLHCTVLSRARAKAAQENGGFNRMPCPRAPPEAALIAGASGGIETLKISHSELDGYAGGRYTVLVPVTRGLFDLLKPHFRAAFRISPRPPQACNDHLTERCITETAVANQPQ